MALSTATYTGDGATMQFSIPFPYISTDDIEVWVGGVQRFNLISFIILNPTTIHTWPAPTGSETVLIKRTTQDTSRLVDFQDAGNLTEADLDLAHDQTFYLAQEAIDAHTEHLSKVGGAYFDAESLQIQNLADPTSNQDAATLAYGEANWGGTAADAAAASAAAAAASVVDAAAEVALAQAEVVNCQDEVVLAAAQVTLATSYATLADAAKVAAQAAQTATEAVLDNFDDRYLGVKASDPTLDNDGDALASGALYWNSVSATMKVYNGSTWDNWAWLALAGGTMTGNLLMKSATYTLNDEGTSGSTITIDWTLGNKAKMINGWSTTTVSFTDPPSACNLVLEGVQDAGGSNSYVWPANVKWPGGTAPTTSTGANDVDVFCFYYNGTDYYGSYGLDYS